MNEQINQTVMDFPIKSPAELIAEIRGKLAGGSPADEAAYALIVGAGFSCPLVPVTKELLHEHIGRYYYFETVYGGAEQVERLCRDYWEQFNEAGAKLCEPTVALDDHGLPRDPSAAYQLLFTYRVANAQFDSAPAPPQRYVDRLKKLRYGEPPKVLAGKDFVRKFLQTTLQASGCLVNETDNAEVRRQEAKLNDAHRFLGLLLKLQQTGQLMELRPFCRTVFTTNFDMLLQNALTSCAVSFRVSDRPEEGLKLTHLPDADDEIHLVYTHGSVLKHNAANNAEEYAQLIRQNAETIKQYLQSKDVLVFGYGGWKDSLMSALEQCDKKDHRLFWCNIFSAEKAQDSLVPDVRDLIMAGDGNAFYVPLGDAGANGFMEQLYNALAATGAHGSPS